jgi:hypothetical protein
MKIIAILIIIALSSVFISCKKKSGAAGLDDEERRVVERMDRESGGRRQGLKFGRSVEPAKARKALKEFLDTLKLIKDIKTVQKYGPAAINAFEKVKKFGYYVNERTREDIQMEAVLKNEMERIKYISQPFHQSLVTLMTPDEERQQ